MFLRVVRWIFGGFGFKVFGVDICIVFCSVEIDVFDIGVDMSLIFFWVGIVVFEIGGNIEFLKFFSFLKGFLFCFILFFFLIVGWWWFFEFFFILVIKIVLVCMVYEGGIRMFCLVMVKFFSFFSWFNNDGRFLFGLKLM